VAVAARLVIQEAEEMVGAMAVTEQMVAAAVVAVAVAVLTVELALYQTVAAAVE
jgi:hypothetical protein